MKNIVIAIVCIIAIVLVACATRYGVDDKGRMYDRWTGKQKTFDVYSPLGLDHNTTWK